MVAASYVGCSMLSKCVNRFTRLTQLRREHKWNRGVTFHAEEKNYSNVDVNSVFIKTIAKIKFIAWLWFK